MFVYWQHKKSIEKTLVFKEYTCTKRLVPLVSQATSKLRQLLLRPVKSFRQRTPELGKIQICTYWLFDGYGSRFSTLNRNSFEYFDCQPNTTSAILRELKRLCFLPSSATTIHHQFPSTARRFLDHNNIDASFIQY
jgi:hypothetical protein